jgi:hypothetical protein
MSAHGDAVQFASYYAFLKFYSRQAAKMARTGLAKSLQLWNQNVKVKLLMRSVFEKIFLRPCFTAYIIITEMSSVKL